MDNKDFKYNYELALETIKNFQEQFGDAHFYFALHAALPSALTPEFLYAIIQKFSYHKDDEVIHFPWIAVSDLLLSNLCKPIGFETFEMDLLVRKILINNLRKDKHLGTKRIKELSLFTESFIEPLRNSRSTFKQHIFKSQKRAAQIHYNPQQVFDELKSELNEQGAIATTKEKTTNSNFNFNYFSKQLDFLLNQVDNEYIINNEYLIHYSNVMSEWANENIENASKICQIYEIENNISFEDYGLRVPQSIRNNAQKADTEFKQEESEEGSGTITLIANSGIQFHTFDIQINPNDDIIRTMGFYEYSDEQKNRVSLQYAYLIPDYDIWVPKKLLVREDYLDKNNNLKDDINPNIVKPHVLKEESDYFEINDILDCLEIFASDTNEDIWLPIPYFKQKSNGKSSFGPISWARMIIKKKSDKKDKKPKYSVVLAFDTKIDRKSSIQIDDNNIVHFTPQEEHTTDDDNYFSLSNNEDLSLNFCDSEYHCGWVNDYLKKIYKEYLEANDEFRQEKFPYLRYLGYYLYMIKYLEALKVFPEVAFYSENLIQTEVDLILDVGNSSTMALLVEHDSFSQFSFNRSQKLIFQDYTDFNKKYESPFSSHFAFRKVNFGDIDSPEYKCFQYPSIACIGEEALKLNCEQQKQDIYSREYDFYHSNIRKYLWDNEKAPVQRAYTNISDNEEIVYFEGISEQFQENGELAIDHNFGIQPFYSNKSLTTFMFIEIILQATRQINSHKYRLRNGYIDYPRKLKRIVLTYPTSTIKKEIGILVQCAKDAVSVINKYYSDNFYTEIEVLPEANDKEYTNKNLSEFDNSFCTQLTFLYAEIKQKFLNNIELYFNLYGKKRNDVSNENAKAITIGSIDIGAANTEFYISSYQYKKNLSTTIINPQNDFKDNYNIGGENLLKQIIQNIIIEGIIKDYLKKQGCKNISETLHSFLRPDTNKTTIQTRQYRKEFTTQILIPIATKYLQHAVNKLDDKIEKFFNFFPATKPNSELIGFINKYFSKNCSLPFKIQEIEWKISSYEIKHIIRTTFDLLIRQISAIMYAYGCDFVLLGGKISEQPKIRHLFMQYLPNFSDRIISLSNYKFGRWHPFSDDMGYVKDTKTIPVTGALISLMAGRLASLEGFKINLKSLNNKPNSIANYIGIYDKYLHSISQVLLSPEIRKTDLVITSFPIILGYKQLPNERYPSKPLFELRVNEQYIRNKILEQNSVIEDEKEIRIEIERYLQKIRERMPLKIRITRDNDMENINIDRITDNIKNEIPSNVVKIKFVTSLNANEDWLNTGTYILNLK